MKFFYLASQLVLYFSLFQTSFGSMNETKTNCNVLSRRKRFITFPEGSSFQLVICTQSPIIMPIGDIIQFSETIALAWSLPENFDFLKDLKHTAEHRMDEKHIYYLDENGKVLDKVPYHRKPIVNPAFAKRSIDSVQSKHVNEIDKKNMHKQTARHYLRSEYMDANSVTSHRVNRMDLYGKLEKLYDAVGYRNGRQCVLKQLCESSKLSEPQGTFFDELLKAVFTFPRKNDSEIDENDFDFAHKKENDCEKLYEECRRE